MMQFFIVLQFCLLMFMVFHDWIPVPPLNNIDAIKKSHSIHLRLFSSILNGSTVLIPLLITLNYYQNDIPHSACNSLVIFYAILTIGTICSWWIPYFFGSSPQHKQGFIEYKQTHHFLPPRGDNVVPNTLHVLLHLQVWICLAISVYLLIIH